MGPSPLGALGRGLAAGVVGTGAMTGAQLAQMKATGSEESSTPGEVAKRIIEGVFKRPVSEDMMPLLNNGMHWVYGTSWGALYGAVAGTVAPRAPRAGLAFGLAVWAASLVQLPAMRLSPPVWEQPPSSIAIDAGYHVVYGIAVATAYEALS